jgi:hypothetical protein
MSQMAALHYNALRPMLLYLWDISCLKARENKRASLRTANCLNRQQFVTSVIFNYLCIFGMQGKSTLNYLRTKYLVDCRRNGSKLWQTNIKSKLHSWEYDDQMKWKECWLPSNVNCFDLPDSYTKTVIKICQIRRLTLREITSWIS